MSGFLEEFVEDTDLQTLNLTQFGALARQRGLKGSFYIKLVAQAGADPARGYDQALHLRIDPHEGNWAVSGDVFALDDQARPEGKPLYSFTSESYLWHEQRDPYERADIPIYAMCDALVTEKVGTSQEASALDKVLVKFTMRQGSIGNLTIGLMQSENLRGLQYLAAQKAGEFAPVHSAFRRIVIDYETAFHRYDGSDSLVTTHADAIREILEDILETWDRKWTGGDRAAASRHLWNALAKAQIDYSFGKRSEPPADMPPLCSATIEAAIETESQPGAADAPEPIDPKADPYLGLPPFRYLIHFTSRTIDTGIGENATFARAVGFADPSGAAPARRHVFAYLEPFLTRLKPSGDWDFGKDEHRDLLRKRLLFAIMHELGHLMNMHHPWTRDLGNCTGIEADPDELSWMAYGYIYPKATFAERYLRTSGDADEIQRVRRKNSETFYQRFFDERTAYSYEEIRHIHNAPYLHIAPNGVDLGSCASGGPEIDLDPRSSEGYRLELTPKVPHEQADFEALNLTGEHAPIQLCQYLGSGNYPSTQSLEMEVKLTGVGDDDETPCRPMSFRTGSLFVLYRRMEIGSDGDIRQYNKVFLPFLDTEGPSAAAFALHGILKNEAGTPHAVPPISLHNFTSKIDLHRLQIVYAYRPGKTIRSKVLDVSLANQNQYDEKMGALLSSGRLIPFHHLVYESDAPQRPIGGTGNWVNEIVSAVEGKDSSFWENNPEFGWIRRLVTDWKSKSCVPSLWNPVLSASAGFGKSVPDLDNRKREFLRFLQSDDLASPIRRSTLLATINQAATQAKMDSPKAPDFFDLRNLIAEDLAKSLSGIALDADAAFIRQRFNLETFQSTEGVKSNGN